MLEMVLSETVESQIVQFRYILALWVLLVLLHWKQCEISGGVKMPVVGGITPYQSSRVTSRA